MKKMQTKLNHQIQKSGGLQPRDCLEPKEPPFTPAEEDAFTCTFETFEVLARSRAARFGSSDAEDIATIALNKVLRRYRQEKGKFEHFLAYVISCERCSANRRESRRHAEPIPLGYDLPDRRVAEAQENRELREIIWLAVRQLSPVDQCLFYLFYERELSIDQIAAGVGRPLAN